MAQKAFASPGGFRASVLVIAEPVPLDTQDIEEIPTKE